MKVSRTFRLSNEEMAYIVQVRQENNFEYNAQALRLILQEHRLCKENENESKSGLHHLPPIQNG